MTEKLLKEIRDLLKDIRDMLKTPSSSNESLDMIVGQENRKQEQKSWAQQLKEKQPQNDYEIIALVVERLTSSEKPSVTKEEIVEFIRNNPDRIKNAGNIEAAIKNTRSSPSYKYIEYAGKKDKNYQLSIKGKQLVKILPERPKTSKKKKKR